MGGGAAARAGGWNKGVVVVGMNPVVSHRTHLGGAPCDGGRAQQVRWARGPGARKGSVAVWLVKLGTKSWALD